MDSSRDRNLVIVVGACHGMTLIERLQIWQLEQGSVITCRFIRSWAAILHTSILEPGCCMDCMEIRVSIALNIRGTDHYNACRSVHDSGRTIAVILTVAKMRDWIKVISIVHGCEQYLVSRFNREIVWQLDSKADSIAATLLSLCS